jgi:hypothetical protein
MRETVVANPIKPGGPFHEISPLRHCEKRENDNSIIWLEAAPDLKIAESRIEQLASFWPGEFQIMDQQNHQVVETIASPAHRNWVV